MTISRRACLLWGGSLASISLLSACVSTSAQSSKNFSQRMVGQARITAVSDGVTRRPLVEGFVKNAKLPEVQAVLAQANLPTEHIDVPYTCYVVELGGKRYLLDTGFGDNGGPGTGLLKHHMREAGIDPDSIDVIILSHLHGDHINGLRNKDGSLAYPNAIVYVPQLEMDFWMDPDRLRTAPAAARGGFENVRRVFASYPTDKLRLFKPGMEIAPGISTMHAPGHTPGHTVIQVRSNGESFTFLGDTTNVPFLFVTRPDWVVQFDMNPEQARATREALLEMMVQEQGVVSGYHFPQPGFGRMKKVTAQGNSYRWVPIR